MHIAGHCEVNAHRYLPLATSQWQFHNETAPLPFGTLYLNGAIGLLNKFLYKHQPKPAPRLIPGTAAAVFFLAEEQAFAHPGRHAYAGIGNTYHYLFAEVEAIDGDNAFFGELIGVGEQVAEYEA